MRLLILLLLVPLTVSAETEIAGRVHVSIDYVDNGQQNDIAMASNATRLSLKGSQPLEYDMVALWKFETELDATGESADLKARNRYVGLVSFLGTVVAGFHDTPYKTILDRVDLMPDSIADSRAILGSVKKYEVLPGGDFTERTVDRFNLRAKYSLMYVSPSIAGVELRALMSPGKGEVDDDDGTTPVVSMSAVYKSQLLYVGAAYEEQKRYRDTGALRVTGGLLFDKTQLNFILEQLDSSYEAKLDRMAGGASLLHRLGDVTLEFQAFHAADFYSKTDTGATLYALGMVYKISKQSELYGIVARMDNDANSTFTLAAGDHGEHYVPANSGSRLDSASMGMIYKF